MGNEDSQELVWLIFEPDYLATLRNVYQWSIVGPDDVDEPKYLISKKLSEVIKRCTHRKNTVANGCRPSLTSLGAWRTTEFYAIPCIV